MPGPKPPINPYITKANSIAESTLLHEVDEQLKAEGFPSYISYSFLETAKATKSIVLSRLPGSVGVDLIEQGYDLKGFHIKAKSCNWGPMQGFICQLPVFNKQGTARIGYNAKEILHYLKHLEHFEGVREKISKAKEILDDNVGGIPETASPADREKSTKEFITTYDKAVLAILREERINEEKTGEWSGENGLGGASPFIPLKRKFDVANLSQLRGVRKPTRIDETTWYGIAENVTDETPGATNKPTVITEFLLKKDEEGDLWQIYHGRIKYKTLKEPADPYDNNFTGGFKGAICTLVDKDLYEEDPKKVYNEKEKKTIADNKKKLNEIFTFDEVEALEFTEAEDLEKMFYADANENIIFGVPQGENKFYPVNGFVNPFPPFQTDDEYYKNAVSGDYDLFAIWPHENVGYNELIRQSEYVKGRFNRMGGKIFTTAMGNSNNFAIEFVPGFSELNPDKNNPMDVLKESAEFGNMNSLCHLVSGLLNSFAATFISDPDVPEEKRIYSTANKGFHSDEGGRPGIMEVEFPIAVYMPVNFTTRALNNFSSGARIPGIAGRGPVETWAGLIKSPEELVLFIKECMEADYRVFMHYRWMIHLLYNTLGPEVNKKEMFDKIIADNLATITLLNKKFKLTDDNLKEFTAIDVNKGIIDARMITANQPLFITNLKDILRIKETPADKDLFNNIVLLFLTFTFMAELPSQKKREMFEDLLKFPA
ncbi:anthrax toxin-like adenylyl cyclase domain-containing protein [Mucilaginibacter sp.]|uniref:anthrax toxin-like adenylyl cyclase domain-containing protein n=1 Tax=Mucilaginibacter sp. TaxID=1882438 RepID=UPI003265DD70